MKTSSVSPSGCHLPHRGNAVNLSVRQVFSRYRTSSFCVSQHVQGVCQVVLLLRSRYSELGKHTVGLRSDGTVVATGWNEYGQCNVSDWTDIRTP